MSIGTDIMVAGEVSPAIAASAYSVQLPTVAAIRQTMDALKAIRTLVADELIDGVDYGPIPGTGKIKDKDGKERERKVMLQPGAQKVVMLFNGYYTHRVTAHELTGGHVEYVISTDIISRATGQTIGCGLGSCSSMESKYRFTSAKRLCPKCGKDTIFRSKKDGEGFYCWKVKDGCGAQFSEHDTAITGQKLDKTEIANPHDIRNTILKMSKKRSEVDASIKLGCLSDMFTQDLEESGTFDLGQPDAPFVPTTPTPTPTDRPKRGPAKSTPPPQSSDQGRDDRREPAPPTRRYEQPGAFDGVDLAKFIKEESARTTLNVRKFVKDYVEMSYDDASYPSLMADWHPVMAVEVRDAARKWIDSQASEAAPPAPNRRPQPPAPAPPTEQADTDEDKAVGTQMIEWIIGKVGDANRWWTGNGDEQCNKSYAMIRQEKDGTESPWQVINHLYRVGVERSQIAPRGTNPSNIQKAAAIATLEPTVLNKEVWNYLYHELPDRHEKDDEARAAKKS